MRTPEERQEIVKRYESGETMRAIAATLNIPLSTVHDALHRADVTARGHVSKEQENRIATLGREGVPGDAIAEQVGVSRASVFRILKDRGIALARGPKSRFSPEEKRTMLERHEAGDSIRAIAATFKCGTMTVYQIVNRAK